jgi:hypothetical protein
MSESFFKTSLKSPLRLKYQVRRIVMRLNRFAFVAPFVLLAFVAVNVPALALDEDDVIWFDFTGWDLGQLIEGGQLFEDICGQMGVEASVEGSFPFGTIWNGTYIFTGQENPGIQSFIFDFFNVPDLTTLVVEVISLDKFEKLTVAAPGTEMYMHAAGGFPIIDPAVPDITLQGIDTMFPPQSFPGATRGFVLTAAQLGPGVTLTISYEALANLKYEFIRVGKLIPEPNSMATCGIGLLGFVAFLRGRKR